MNISKAENLNNGLLILGYSDSNCHVTGQTIKIMDKKPIIQMNYLNIRFDSP